MNSVSTKSTTQWFDLSVVGSHELGIEAPRQSIVTRKRSVRVAR
ncbi:hypothetical protein IAD21_03835 [Abditibacteriota bacterium]|nr:hypothetical protein IAD21_03835 [Abditibacteriota bacterium]